MLTLNIIFAVSSMTFVCFCLAGAVAAAARSQFPLLWLASLGFGLNVVFGATYLAKVIEGGW